MPTKTLGVWHAAAVVSALVLVGPFLVVPGAPPDAALLNRVPALGHVFVLVGENTELSQLTMATAPYLLGSLKPQAAWLTNYYAVGHHSLANYIGMTSGQFTACDRADGIPADCHQTVDNLFHQLDAANVSWQVWLQSMPGPCALTSPGNLSDVYPIDHNPAIYYDTIVGPAGMWSSTSPSVECRARVLPTGTVPGDLSAFNAALSNGTPGRFNLVIPDECGAGERSCPPISNRILQFDRFLATEVPRILGSPAFGTNGLLIITYDEGTSGHFNLHDRFGRGGRVAFAVLGPLVRPGVYPMYRDHFGLLRTLEDGFGLPAYLGNAARAMPIDAIWVA